MNSTAIRDQWLRIDLALPAAQVELAVGLLSRLEPAGLWETDQGISLFIDARPAAPVIARIRSLLTPAGLDCPGLNWTVVPREDWHLRWQDDFHPIPLTRRIAIVPEWEHYDGPQEIGLKVRPGMAFGTGTHATTQLALRLLEHHLSPGDNVLDAGCGSGILAIAAVKMGAAAVDAWDIDPETESGFLAHLALNGLPKDRIRLTIGDATTLTGYPYDLILSNIERRPNLRLLEAITRSNSPARVIFTGILQEEEAEFCDAVARAGRRICDRLTQDEWLALVVAPFQRGHE